MKYISVKLLFKKGKKKKVKKKAPVLGTHTQENKSDENKEYTGDSLARVVPLSAGSVTQTANTSISMV